MTESNLAQVPDKFTPGTRREGRTFTVDELFPRGAGHQYLNDDDMARLRELSMGTDDVTMPPRTAMEIVCDWRNMDADLQTARFLLDKMHPKDETYCACAVCDFLGRS